MGAVGRFCSLVAGSSKAEMERNGTERSGEAKTEDDGAGAETAAFDLSVSREIFDPRRTSST